MKRDLLKRLNLLHALILVLAGLQAHPCYAQTSLINIQQSLEEEMHSGYVTLNSPAKVRDFYKSYQYKAAWVAHESFRHELFNYLQEADELALKKGDYHFSFIQSVCTGSKRLSTGADSLQAEFIFTDAAIHFFTEAAYGSHPPEMRFNGLNYSPSCRNIPNLLAIALTANKLNNMLDWVECKSPEYQALKSYLYLLNDAVLKSKLGKPVSAGRVGTGTRQLREKLFYLHLLDSLEKNISDKELKSKLVAAQKLFSLVEDSTLTPALIRELNIPLEYRVAELGRAINTVRWIRCLREQSQHLILVNIPSASLVVFRGDHTVLQSRVIVGKPSTRTPVFAAKVDEVVLYPYWMVPKSIAIKELLPHIKRNINYLNTNGFQVVNLQGKLINPASINWHALHAGNFPYILRQSTGCDNSLGIVKLNFYNPFSVYLHDTPAKTLFKSNRRFFSHGCMRVEKALELAHLLLKGNTIAIDTIEEKGCLRNQKPIPVSATEKMPLLVLYNTAWVDSAGVVKFYPDVYKKLPG